MKNFDLKNILYIIMAAFILLIIIYFIGRSAGKAKSANEAKNPVYPNNGQGIPAGWDPNNLADSLYDKISGTTWNKSALNTVLQQFLALPTNDMFVAVYSVYNEKYFGSGGGTLREQIKDEDYNFPIAGFPDNIRPLIYKRMDLLNLK